MPTTAESPNRHPGAGSTGLPDFIVIGALKAGTTSLRHYLSCHPEIAMAATDEPALFTTAGRVETWFAEPGSLRGEVSSDYTQFPRHPGVPARMHAILPNAKLVYLVRDPIERIVAQYVGAHAFRRPNATLDQVLAKPEGRHYVTGSKYFSQLERYLPYYDFEQFLVVGTEDLATRRGETLGRVFRFLQVDDSFTSPEFDRALYAQQRPRVGAIQRFARSARTASRAVPSPELSPARRRELADELRPDVSLLREFTGDAFAAWSL